MSAVERGSALAIVPAAFLVLIVLGALAADSAVAYLAQQQLHDALSAAANDAVAASLSDRFFYTSGRLVLNPERIDAVVCRAVQAQGDSDLRDEHIEVAISGRGVRVIGGATVDAVFGRAIPGFARRSVHSSASAFLSRGTQDTGPPQFPTPEAVICPP